MNGLPYIKFFPNDWQADEGIRMLSLAARGLWFEMLLVMHKAQGYLRVNDRAVSVEQLARLAGCNLDECQVLVGELRRAGIFSETDEGMIYSRRILRDLEKVEQAREYGKRGGNPGLKGGVNPPDNPPPNGGDNPEDKARDKARARASQSQSPESDSERKSVSRASAHHTHAREATTTTDDFYKFGESLLASLAEPDPDAVLEALLRKHHGKPQWAIAKLDKIEAAHNRQHYYERLRSELDIRPLQSQRAPRAPQVFVIEDSPAWHAWRERRRGRSLPVTQHGSDRGWFFPSEFPPPLEALL